MTEAQVVAAAETTTALATVDELRPLELEHFTLSATGLVVKGGLPPFEVWAGIGDMLATIEKGVAWIIGDWLAFGEATYGERASQVIDARRFSEETVRNFRWVASKVPPENRCPALSFTHHQIVAELPPREQRRWLEKALNREGAETWPVAKLRAELAAAGAKETRLTYFVTAECPNEAACDALTTEIERKGYRTKKHVTARKVKGEKAPTAKRTRKAPMNATRRKPQ